MILAQPELLLLAGIAGLYLYDSALLLESNEALLAPTGSAGWIALFGAKGFLVRGKEPFLPNPLLPHRPLYRFAWNAEGLVGPNRPWLPPAKGYAALAPSIWLMFLALFVLIPLGLLSHIGNRALIAGIALFYFNAVSALTMVWLRRDDYEIDARRFASLAFESLSCPPFALNLVKHLSLGIRPKEDFLAVIYACLPDAERNAALEKVIARVENAIDWEEEGTPRARALNAHLRALTGDGNAYRAPGT